MPKIYGKPPKSNPQNIFLVIFGNYSHRRRLSGMGTIEKRLLFHKLLKPFPPTILVAPKYFWQVFQ